MNNLNSFYLLTGLFMVVSTVMILVILMQRPKGGGLSAAFGGSSAGSADSRERHGLDYRSPGRLHGRSRDGGDVSWRPFWQGAESQGAPGKCRPIYRR